MVNSMISAVDRAKYGVVHDFKRDGRRGAAALAPLVGIGPAVLSNKVNFMLDTHHLTVDEAVMIQDRAGDFRIIEAEAMELGGVFIKLPAIETVSDLELLRCFSEWKAYMGRTCEVLHEALEDGRISAQECDCVRRHGYAHIARFFQLLYRLEELRQ